MYQWLVKLNKNHGYATDEHNNISIVSKENEGYELEDILNKENSLEELDINLDEKRKDLSTLKSKTIWGRSLSALTILGETVLWCCLHPYNCYYSQLNN